MNESGEIKKKYIATMDRLKAYNDDTMLASATYKYMQKNILFIGQHFYITTGEKRFSNVLKKVFSNFKDLQHVLIKVKMHPRDKKPNLWDKAFKANSITNCQIINACQNNDNEQQLFNLLDEADIVVGFYSNVLIQALMFYKQVVQIDIDGIDTPFKGIESFKRYKWDKDFSKEISELIYKNG